MEVCGVRERRHQKGQKATTPFSLGWDAVPQGPLVTLGDNKAPFPCFRAALPRCPSVSERRNLGVARLGHLS